MEKLKFNISTIKVDKGDIIDELLENVSIRAFLMKNDLSAEDVERHLLELMNYNIDISLCNTCTGTHECKQDTFGIQPHLAYIYDKIRVNYSECDYKVFANKANLKGDNIDYLFIPESLREAKFEDFDFTLGKNRTIIHNKMINFISSYVKGEKPDGLYLYGEYSKGKTYMIAALANELSARGIKVILAYYPDLAREIKSMISTNNLEATIKKLKTIDILMLDDIGGENLSPWVRDEVLGPILQHRLLDKRPTFFTSNVDLKQLLTYLCQNNQKVEISKGARIVSRIAQLSTQIEV